MAGIGENTGGWLPPTSPSPRTLFSSVLAGALDSQNPSSQLPSESKIEGPFPISDQAMDGNNDHKDEKPSTTSPGDQLRNDGLLDTSASAEQKCSSRGGLSERVAARAGFNAPKLNTEGMRGGDPSQVSGLRSPYLTIPPGLSPTALLESPVFLTNSMVQPSPTTGKFLFCENGDSKSSIFDPATMQSKKESLVEDGNASFTFKPVLKSQPTVFSEALNKLSFTTTETPGQINSIFDRVDSCNNHERNLNTLRFQAGADANMSDKGAFDLVHQGVEGDQKSGDDVANGGAGACGSNSGGAASDDGYNWRKYGQKQVKGSEYPRSYYKCTQPNCTVKKKVERSQEGHITDIIYKGAHNHPKPPSNKRGSNGFSNQMIEVSVDTSEIGRLEVDPSWLNAQNRGAAAALEWRNDNPEVMSSASGGTDLYPQSTTFHAQNAIHPEAVDVSSTLSNEDDEDDRGTHGSVSLGCDDGEESESKRRKTEAYVAELSGASRAIREPRVVVQTTSEVDILDDGYRWRKYGQKVVKGNPNPRSYYKCTHPGCNVRKHVERASHDLKSVITTYEGKHNHDVPAARNGSHINSNASSNPAQAAGVHTHLHRPEASQVNNSNLARFDGHSSFCSFGISSASHPVNSRAFSFGMNQPSVSNLGMTGFASNQRMPAFHSSYLAQRQMNQGGYRAEPKVERPTESALNLPSGPSVYHQLMGRLPLGHQM